MEGKKMEIKDKLSVIAIIVSFIAVSSASYISCQSLKVAQDSLKTAQDSLKINQQNAFSYPGTVDLARPSAYAILRGVPQFGFPSDHIVLPLEIKNTGGLPVFIKNLQLNLTAPNGKTHKFILAGEYASISSRVFQDLYTLISSFSVRQRDISNKILVFHIQDWWNQENKETYQFHFNEFETYNAVIKYTVEQIQDSSKESSTEKSDPKSTEEKEIVFPLFFPKSIKDLKQNTGKYWDYHTIQ